MFRQSEEHGRLERLEKELNSARLQGLDHCVKCGFCCNKRTCIPTPDELRTIAEFLKMTPEELIKTKYAIDYMGMSDNYVKPLGANILDLAGQVIPSERTFDEGDCVFLAEDKLCSIYEVRPQQARDMSCWDSESGKGSGAIDAWKGDKLKEEFGIDS